MGRTERTRADGADRSDGADESDGADGADRADGGKSKEGEGLLLPMDSGSADKEQKRSIFKKLWDLFSPKVKNPLPFGRIIKHRYGRFVYIYRPIRIRTDGKHITELLNISPESVSLLTTCEQFDNLHLKNILFLDIETLSLSPDSSNVVMIGIGFYRGGKFHIEQFFSLGNNDEAVILYALKKRIRYFSYISGYNVKSFDANFVKRRGLMKDIEISFDNKDFIDMNVATRRFFKERTNSFSLTNMINLIFGEYRTDDIPSNQIPTYWDHYIKTRNPTYAIKIIEHNRNDLVDAIKLFVWFFSRMRKPFGYYFENEDDKEAVFRLLDKFGKKNRF